MQRAREFGVEFRDDLVDGLVFAGAEQPQQLPAVLKTQHLHSGIQVTEKGADEILIPTPLIKKNKLQFRPYTLSPPSLWSFIFLILHIRPSFFELLRLLPNHART